MKVSFLQVLVLVCLSVLCIPACSPSTSSASEIPTQVSNTGEVVLTPYFTRTATVTPTGTNPATRTPFPTPTATPRIHEVKQGEDMFGISLRYGITIEELMTANPDVSPNLMSVGTMLVIPASALPDEAEEAVLTPAAVDVEIGDIQCYPSAEGGLWCIASAQNGSDIPLESVTGLVRLADGNGIQVGAHSAITPVNILVAGGVLPLMVYFPPPTPETFQVNIELLTAFPIQAIDERYVPARIENALIDIAADGLSAQLEGEVWLEDADRNASLVWVAAVAYDHTGMIAGVRRWEHSDRLQINEPLQFTMFLYSLKEQFARIELFVEARP